MYLELYKTGTFNLKIAQVFGLDVAVYWSALTTEMEKAKDNKKVDKESYFPLDRDAIKKLTTLKKSEQIICEEILRKANVIEYHGSLEDHEDIRVDLQTMMGYIVQDDPKVLKQLIKEVVENTKESRKNGARLGFKDYVVTLVDDFKLADLLRDWVDSVYESCKYGNFLNKPIIDTFVKSIQDYSKDIEVQKAIVKIALISAVKDAWWAIESYQKQHARNLNNLSMTGTAKHVSVDEKKTF